MSLQKIKTPHLIVVTQKKFYLKYYKLSKTLLLRVAGENKTPHLIVVTPQKIYLKIYCKLSETLLLHVAAKNKNASFDRCHPKQNSISNATSSQKPCCCVSLPKRKRFIWTRIYNPQNS